MWRLVELPGLMVLFGLLCPSCLADPDAASNSIIMDPLREWIYDLDVPLPGNMTAELPGGLGPFTLINGHCWGLVIDDVQSVDLSEEMIMEFGVKVTGVGISCSVYGFSHGYEDDETSSGYVHINITMANSSFGGSVSLAPYISNTTGELPLPLGQVNSTSCSAKLKATAMSWEGTGGVLLETLEDYQEKVLNFVGVSVEEPLCDAFATFLNVNGTAFLTESRKAVEKLLEEPEPTEDGVPQGEIVDWGTYAPMKVVRALVEERWPLFAGRAVDIMNVADLSADLVTFQGITFSLMGLHIYGVVDGLRENVHILANDTRVGFAAGLEGMRLTAKVGIDAAIPGQTEFSGSMNLTFGLGEMMMVIRAMVGEDELNNLRLDEAMTSPGCAAELFDSTSDPREAALQIDTIRATLMAPVEVHAVSLAGNAATLVNAIFESLLTKYHSSMDLALNGGLGVTRKIIESYIWKKLDSMAPCAHGGELEVLGERGIVNLYWATFWLAVGGLLASALVHLAWDSHEATPQPEGDAESAAAQGSPTTSTKSTMNAQDELDIKPLCLQSFVPMGVAVYYVFAVVACLLLFVVADLDVGATVKMVMVADEDEVALGPLFSFSLIGTIVHCWSSGAYAIAILTVLASGAWPMLKLCMLIVAWTVPPRYFSLSARGSVLHFLDTWGKYSFLDSWFLVVTLSAFAINWASVRAGAAMKIQTTPEPAFYAFLTATVLSLILGHVASECHHTALARKQHLQNPVAQPQVVRECSTQALALYHYANSRLEKFGIVAMLVGSVIISVQGMFLPSFSFEASGILTDFLYSGNIEKTFSIFSVGAATAEGRYGEPGLICLQTIFVTLAIFLPLLLLTSLLALWTMPLTRAQQSVLLRGCHLLDAWACLDVAVLVMAIACSEFARLATFLVYKGNFAEPCNLIRDLTNNECLDIKLHPHPPLVMVFVSGVLFVVMPKVAMRTLRRSFAARNEEANSKAKTPSSKDKEFNQNSQTPVSCLERGNAAGINQISQTPVSRLEDANVAVLASPTNADQEADVTQDGRHVVEV